MSIPKKHRWLNHSRKTVMFTDIATCPPGYVADAATGPLPDGYAVIVPHTMMDAGSKPVATFDAIGRSPLLDSDVIADAMGVLRPRVERDTS